MFPLGAAFLLLGYSGLMVSVCRLAGDSRTITGIITGANGGNLLRTTDSGDTSAAAIASQAVGGGVVGGVVGGDVKLNQGIDSKIIGGLKKLVP